MIEVKKLNGGPEDYDFLVRLCSLALESNASLDGSIYAKIAYSVQPRPWRFENAHARRATPR